MARSSHRRRRRGACGSPRDAGDTLARRLDAVLVPDTEGTSERWAICEIPTSRAEWKTLRAEREAQGFAGIVLPNDPRLLDLVRNPDVEDDRADIRLAFG